VQVSGLGPFKIVTAMRTIAPGLSKSRVLCPCCADYVTLFFQIAGGHVAYRELRTFLGNAITRDDVLDVHDALAKYEGTLAGLG
jgi:hypothetical protein